MVAALDVEVWKTIRSRIKVTGRGFFVIFFFFCFFRPKTVGGPQRWIGVTVLGY